MPIFNGKSSVFSRGIDVTKNFQKVFMRLELLSAETPNRTMGVQDGSYSILEVDGVSRLNGPYRYTVTFASDEELQLEKLADTDAKIAIRDENNALRKRDIYGKIYRIEEASVVARKYLYKAVVVSPFYYLQFNRRYKVYQGMSVPEIITAVIGMTSHILGLSVESKLDPSTFPKRETCTQHNQSDAEFILMLAQEECFAITFESAASDPYKIVLSNINEHVCKLDETLPCGFDRAKHFAPTHQTENFYDFETPGMDYATEYGAEPEAQMIRDNNESSRIRSELAVQSIRDRLEQMGGSRMKDLKRYAKLDMRSSYSPVEVISGESESLYTEAAWLTELYEQRTQRKMKVILVAATLEGKFPNALDEYMDETAEYAFGTTFEAIPYDTPYVPDTKIVKPVISGVQTAIVASGSPDTASGENTIDVDALGRIRVIFHFDREKPTSCYVRLGTIYSGNNWGAQFLPRVNTEVIVSFINGDIDRPVIVGALYNGDNAIPQGLPDSKTKSYIKTQSTPGGGGYNELLFEDKAGEELLSLRAQKDYKLHALNDSTINIDHDQSETVGNDETVSIGHDRSESVGNDETISVGHDRNESVGNDENLAVGSNRSRSVGSNESVQIGSNLSVTVGGNHTETVSQNKAETIAIAKALTVGAGLQTTVGGAKNVTVGLSSTEQVGLLKHIIAGKRFELQVGESSLILNADGTIILKGKEIEINGAKQVTVNGKMVELN